MFRNEIYSRRDAFVWLIEHAAYRPERVHAPTGEVVLERGELCHSLRFMAKAWRWEESKVRRFISSLQAAKIIDASNAAGQKRITICNYDKYQASASEADAEDAAAPPQHHRGDDAKKKEGKEGNKEKHNAREDFSISEFASAACRAAGMPIPDWRRAVEYQTVVQEWLTAGADEALILETLAARAPAAQQRDVRSLRWFEGAIRDAVAARAQPRRAEDRSTDFIMETILKRIGQ